MTHRNVTLSATLAAGIALGSPAGASVLTLEFSEVFAGTLAEPNRDPLEISFASAFSPTTATSSLVSGAMAFYVENPSDNSNSSADTAKTMRFTYSGARLTIPAGALRLAVDATRFFDLPNIPNEVAVLTTTASLFIGDVGVSRTVDLQASIPLPGGNGCTPDPKSFCSVVLVNGTGDLRITRDSVNGDAGFIESETVVENLGFGAFRQELVLAAPEITLEDGDELEIRTTFRGAQSSGVPFDRGGSFIIDAQSTAQLSFALPAGVSVVGQDGAPLTLDWITPVPLPAAGWMLLAGLGGLALAGRHRA